jgi:dolichol-phosphate mannosyltransferase
MENHGTTERVAVALPTYNESDNIIAAIRAVHEHLPHAAILVIDDSSPDGTAELVTRFAEDHGFVSVHVRQDREGLGAAYIDGFRRLLDRGCDAVVQMDADLSHDPALLPRFVEKFHGGADLVIGSRYVRGGGTENWPFLRKLISRAGSAYAALCLGVPVRDLTGGFKCWRAGLLGQVIRKELLVKGFGFQVEMTYRAFLLGANITEIPITFRTRREGQSKMSGAIAREALFGIPRLRLAGRDLVATDELP